MHNFLCNLCKVFPTAPEHAWRTCQGHKTWRSLTNIESVIYEIFWHYRLNHFPGPKLAPAPPSVSRSFGSSTCSRIGSAIQAWHEEAFSGDRTGPNPASKAASAPVAPRCDVTASNSTHRSRANQPGFLFPGWSDSELFGFWGVCEAEASLRESPIVKDFLSDLCGFSSRTLRLKLSLQQGTSGSRNTFISSSAGAIPSGKLPRLYSAIRFFHFKKSVMLCGSILTSTRRKLASSRFIS